MQKNNVKKAKKSHSTVNQSDTVQLIIDIGTHAVRAAIVSFDLGKPVIDAIFSSSLALTRHSESHVEQSPDEIVQKTLIVIQQALASNEKTVSKAALAIQRSTVLAWRTDGRALSPALSWQDTRAALFVNELQKTSVATKIQYLSGLPLSPHYGASKLRWLAEGLGDSYSNEQLRLSPLVSYVLFHLLDQQPYVCDESNAGRTQLMDIRTRQWNPWLCDTFDVSLSCLPKLVPVQQKYGHIKDTAIELEFVSGDQNAAFQYVRWLSKKIRTAEQANDKKIKFKDIKFKDIKNKNIKNKDEKHRDLKNNDTPCIAINLGSGAFVLRDDKSFVSPYSPKQNTPDRIYKKTKLSELSDDNKKDVFFETIMPETFQGYDFLKSLVFSDNESTDYVQEGTVNGVGTALSWIQEKWLLNHIGSSDDDFFSYIDNLIFEKKPSVLFINTLGGLGSPFWRSDEIPRFVDMKKVSVGEDNQIIDLDLTSGYLTEDEIQQRMDECVNAVVESIVFLIVINIQRMMAGNASDVDVEPNIFVSGGVSRISVLVQKICDLLAVSVYRLLEFDATILGLSVSAFGDRNVSSDGGCKMTEASMTDDPLFSCKSYHGLFEFYPNSQTKESQQLKKRCAMFTNILMRFYS